MCSVFVWKLEVNLCESENRYLCLKVLSVFVMVSWRRRRWWPHISCPCLSGSGFSLLAVLLFTLLLTRTCLEFRISRFSSPLLAFRYRPLYYSSALTHTNFHNTLISQICPATQNWKWHWNVAASLDYFGLYSNPGLPIRDVKYIFIGPESDHWLCLSVTHTLTD